MAVLVASWKVATLLHQQFQEGLQVDLALVDPLLELGLVHQGLMCQVPHLLGELLQLALGILLGLGTFGVLLLLWLYFDLLFHPPGPGKACLVAVLLL